MSNLGLHPCCFARLQISLCIAAERVTRNASYSMRAHASRRTHHAKRRASYLRLYINTDSSRRSVPYKSATGKYKPVVTFHSAPEVIYWQPFPSRQTQALASSCTHSRTPRQRRSDNSSVVCPADEGSEVMKSPFHVLPEFILNLQRQEEAQEVSWPHQDHHYSREPSPPRSNTFKRPRSVSTTASENSSSSSSAGSFDSDMRVLKTPGDQPKLSIRIKRKSVPAPAFDVDYVEKRAKYERKSWLNPLSENVHY